jgi:hypothetical protein
VLGRVAGGKFQRRSRTKGVAKHIEGLLDSGAHSGIALLEIGLTACRGDGWRDTVANTLMRDFGHVCGGTDGARQGAAIGRIVIYVYQRVRT